MEKTLSVFGVLAVRLLDFQWLIAFCMMLTQNSLISLEKSVIKTSVEVKQFKSKFWIILQEKNLAVHSFPLIHPLLLLYSR